MSPLQDFLREQHLVDAAPTPIVLPSAAGEVTISESARVLFERLAYTETLFRRGGALVELIDAGGNPQLQIVKPNGFRSRAEQVGPLCAYRLLKSEPVLKPVVMTADQAAALMESTYVELLPPITSVRRCPSLVELDGKATVLGRGYHRAAGGILIAGDVDVSGWESITVADAAASLRWLIAEMDFQTEGDRTRALAAFITPALRMGGHLKGPIPIDVAEADQSQSGKGYRHQLVTMLYSESAYFIASRNGGVGSTDESFSAGLIAGRPFICLDNLRGKVDSQMLEAFITSPDLFPARVPHRGEVLIDSRQFLLQMSSNGIETTRDLANRSSICRIRKRPGFQYRDTLGLLRSSPGTHLAAVFRLVAEWIEAGKPRTKEARHDLREWCQTLDWICRELMGTGPLMDGHQAAQERTSNPALTWLRLVALAVEADHRLGQGLIASEIVELCAEHDIEVRGSQGDDGKASRAIGMTMKRLFAEGETIEVDGFTITRGSREYRKTGGDPDTTHEYTFCRL